MNWEVLGWSLAIFAVHCGFNYLWFLLGKMKAQEDIMKYLRNKDIK